MSTINFGGLVSGLDTDTILTQLVALERRPIELLDEKQTTHENRLSAFQELNSKLLSFQTQAEALNEAETFQAVSVTSSDETVLTGTSSSSSNTGVYTIEVTQLAQTHKLSSDSFTDSETALNFSGDILVNGELVSIATTDSVNNIRDKINTANAGVSASVLQVSSTDYRLMLTSEETGSTGIDLVDSNTTDVLQSLGLINSSTSTQDYSDLFSSDTTAVGTMLGLSSPQSGTVQINGVELNIDLANDSLTDIRDRINSTPGIGTTASITSEVVDETTKYKLELSGTNTYTDQNNILETLGFVNGVIKNEQDAAQDAIIKMGQTNPITITRSSNIIDDAIEGVTLNLNKSEPGTQVSLTVNGDTDTVKQSIQDFVDAYNDVISYIDEQMSYDAENSTRGPLRGDFTARTIKSTLQRVMSSEVSGLSSSLTALSRIGITSSASDGAMSIDDTKLTSALTSDLTDVKDLFTGLTDDLTDKLDSYTDPYDGLIANRIEGTQDIIDDGQDRMDTMEVRVSQREEQLRAQFQAMEIALAQLQSQSAFLAQQSTIYRSR